MTSGPTDAQRAAADPNVSAWVGANAGSGKTRVLTERVARLLLSGAGPDRILCLTYTKAAATEMQSRLFDRLGTWALADDASLAAELTAIEGRALPPDSPRLRAARRLFAAALETPGGLKIQTIHAFCSALLRRFPLEAGLSPRLRLMDDRAAALMLRRIVGDMARDAETGRDTAFDAAASRLNEADVDKLVAIVLSERARLQQPNGRTEVKRLFGPRADGIDLTAQAALATLERLDARPDAQAATLTASGGQDAKRGAALAAALALPEAPAVRRVRALIDACLRTDRAPYKKAAKKATLSAEPWLEDAYLRLADWAQQADADLRAADTAERSLDLYRFAGALVTRYETAKRARGLIDYHDLIAHAVALLTRSNMAAWALYKLDDGIDHVLVDEAQDTSPLQWQLIEALTGEFFVGQGRSTVRRTVFAVGDEKQSIYRFQGAEPRAFGDMRRRFAKRIGETGAAIAEPALVTSFRSAPGILSFVDAVFAERSDALMASGARIEHRANRTGDAARVDLWPLVARETDEDAPNWWEPGALSDPETPRRRLAEGLAAEIARMIREERRPARDGRPGARVHPGDILVLVRTRAVLARALIRQLKTLGVPVAGADRLRLGAELAVKDLVALLKVAVQPEDDLSLAAVLRSPLAEVDEAALYDLAHGRTGHLVGALRAASDRHPREAAMVTDILDQAGFLTPYGLLERILINHDGRRRLIARLGPEAEDLIDELLEQALLYETREPPTLAGFIDWIEADDISVKREMRATGEAEAGPGEVRVMTVHGAKGLEAPIVILPDTVGRSRQQGPSIVPSADNRCLLWLASGATDAASADARAAAVREDEREALRLLYVALTRAEDWLILCGADKGQRPPDDWYALLEQTLTNSMEASEPARPLRTPFGPGWRLESGTAGASTAPEGDVEAGQERPPDLPPWLSPAPVERRPPARNPSMLLPHAPIGDGMATLGLRPNARLSREAAREHGTAVHLLLERLADLPADRRPALAERLLRSEAPGLGATARDAVLAEALDVLSAPFAMQVFGPGSVAEATLSPRIGALSEAPMIGRVDRLVVHPDQILIVDFKTDGRVPADPADTPAAYVAQLAAYATAAREIWPDRNVEAAILWTAVPALVPLPDALLSKALARATRPET